MSICLRRRDASSLDSAVWLLGLRAQQYDRMRRGRLLMASFLFSALRRSSLAAILR
jgi:hypothetical protein